MALEKALELRLRMNKFRRLAENLDIASEALGLTSAILIVLYWILVFKEYTNSITVLCIVITTIVTAVALKVVKEIIERILKS